MERSILIGHSNGFAAPDGIMAEMAKQYKIALVIVAGLLLYFAGIAFDFFDPGSVPHTAISYWLENIGRSVYEYHSKNGRWPATVDDLAETAVFQRAPNWKQMLDDRTIVVVLDDDLKPDPQENAGRVLVYHNKGLFAWSLGKVWVCWGDLRTEYIKSADLKIKLQH
jgi:hypothetical protein